MIVKTFEINKKKIDKQNFFLIYGDNEGLKKEIIQNLKKILKGNIDHFDEAQILVDNELFYEKIFNQSLFENIHSTYAVQDNLIILRQYHFQFSKNMKNNYCYHYHLINFLLIPP